MNSGKKALPLFLLCARILWAAAAPLDPLEAWIGKADGLFRDLKADTFLSRPDLPETPYFRWISDKKSEARYPGYRNSPELTFCSFRVPEILLTFEENDLSRITVSVYNRGDMGRITEESFEEILNVLEAYFNTLTASRCRESKVTIASSGFRQKKWFLSDEFSVTIRYALSGKRREKTSEYIQVIYEKRSVSADRERSLPAQENYLKNVRKEADGTVFVDNVPMVDQGAKGYCAVAVAERVMRYYGNQNIDQHTMAQLAETTQGTSIDNLMEAMRRVARRFKLRFREYYQLKVETFKDAERVLKRYNSTAKKMKKNKLNFVLIGRTISWPATAARMEPEVYCQMRLAEKTEMAAFLKTVKNCVDRGIPLIWSVILGIVKEEGLPQARGGHLRLIIGYNEAQKQIVFSDTWGMGHEKKKMSYDDAWIITKDVMTLEP